MKTNVLTPNRPSKPMDLIPEVLRKLTYQDLKGKHGYLIAMEFYDTILLTFLWSSFLIHMLKLPIIVKVSCQSY